MVVVVLVDPLVLGEDVAVLPQPYVLVNQLPQVLVASRIYSDIWWGPMPFEGW